MNTMPAARCVGAFAALFTLALAPAPASADGAAELRALTRGHARVVWLQDRGDGRDTFAVGSRLRLMGLDTADRRGERALLRAEGAWRKPLLTADGDRVVYTEGEGQVRVVGWDGRGDRAVTGGYAADVWRDPATGVDWVYFQAPAGRRESPLYRCRLDGSGERQRVWDRTAASLDSFQLSADGTRAAGLFPWPRAGIAELPNRDWKELAHGCWTALAPDDSYRFWVFDEGHRAVTFVAPGGVRWPVDLHDAPGMNGWEVYHPRWSNDPRFLVVTGPYSRGPMGRNNIRAGGPQVEIYAGRFASDFRRVERWARVTRNDKADFYPDLWVEPAAKP